jgi:hypothetical protein
MQIYTWLSYIQVNTIITYFQCKRKTMETTNLKIFTRCQQLWHLSVILMYINSQNTAVYSGISIGNGICIGMQFFATTFLDNSPVYVFYPFCYMRRGLVTLRVVTDILILIFFASTTVLMYGSVACFCCVRRSCCCRLCLLLCHCLQLCVTGLEVTHWLIILAINI